MKIYTPSISGNIITSINPTFKKYVFKIKFCFKIIFVRNWRRKFLKILREDDEFAAEVRALLLSEELLNLSPKFDRLEKKVDRLEKDADYLKRKVNSLEKDVGYLKGSDRERWYRDRAHAIFGKLVLKGKPYEKEAAETLAEAYKKGQISKGERDEVLSADLLWGGEKDGKFLVLVVEVSYTISGEDVQRAKRRAEILRKIGVPAIPVVGGVKIGKGVKLEDIVWVKDGKCSEEEFERMFQELCSLKLSK